MKVAILWFINENNELLLAKRSATISSNPNLWGPSVSGVVDDGETFAQAAVREASEELGIDPFEALPIHHLHDASHNAINEGEQRELSIFHSPVDSQFHKRLKLAEEEVAEVRWISLEGLRQEYSEKPETLIVSSDKSLWDDIFLNLEALLQNKTILVNATKLQ